MAFVLLAFVEFSVNFDAYRYMKPISHKAAKSLTILLFLLVFLTAAVAADASSDGSTSMDKQSAFHFDLKREKSPVPFLFEFCGEGMHGQSVRYTASPF